ncbi:FAD-linked oxidase C-terminal domain-containing protein [Paraburkholderia agricolaris]|uniref:FAD-linked oxidase C-terminal domain-containing protein n=1 Tax=Paraburkholderia agricolaris TaxID=2152888 RepID=UPI0012925B72|nr:FAD-linked oxidase C-terminal domain-containing protein [Paraburkholderia agricolaris]
MRYGDVSAAIERLKPSFGDRLSLSAAVREQHGKDTTFHPVRAPDAVVFPNVVEEVQQIVRVCADLHVPIIPFGTGTSCEGHVAALHGGICVDTSQLRAVRAIRVDDLDATVEAGVTRKELNAQLHGTGLHFPIDPGADASIGGMVSTRASGTNAVRYGTMREQVLNLEIVLPDGSLVHTGTRARKSAAGYDLTHLFVGSEGTLGIVTAVTLKLHAIPEHIAVATCSFPELSQAVQAVIQTVQAGVPIGRVELLDDTQVEAVNRYSKLALSVAPTLIFEFHGSRGAVQDQIELVKDIADANGGCNFEWAERPEDRSRLWKARHDIWWANLALRPGSQGLPTDVCVPISQLAANIQAAKEDVLQADLIAPICGHVGDGNFHLCFVVNPDCADEMRRVGQVNRRMIERALACGGTCTGEHGIGYGKIDFLRQEAGNAFALHCTVKRAFDPAGIMNPGKITGEPFDAATS